MIVAKPIKKIKFPRLSIYRNSNFLFPIDLPGNQPGAIRLSNKPIAPGFSVVSKGKSKSGRPRKTFGNMRFYAFLWARPSPFSCLNSSNCVSPTIATISTDARKTRVDCRCKILLNSWSYGARLVAARQFDSMSSVVGDRAVAQADRSLPRCDGRNWCQCCYEVVTTTGAMWAIGTVEERVKIKLFNTYDALFIRVYYFCFI